ncbi:energy-coupling factor transporter ATPase [Tyzzerella sp. An114]|uniref:energy-coupling factor transporter ATPase n=1 Tax=Tyzzerella sp. An114 TaxID=1965545 RepID=UPI000B4482C6|nr:energy-coupling factor transporter ATPase [Tyzzerella sp. An114]OUQ58476.1 energy-coupling factor transporter ATPase [Tyzzerella sp. An114]HIT73722.1 energy-coupling factor transporter ATPase [Candidatus Fimicola cottocaccae]
MDMVKAKGLTYEYKRMVDTDEGTKEEKFLALKNVNIAIEKGEFVAVLGHNGSGKSTFAKHINALVKPTEGTLWIKGFDTKNDEFVWDIRQSAGMVFQNPDNQLVATVVEEDIAFGPENLGLDSKEIHNRVDSALDTVRMQEYRKNSPSKLSGGQKQRIAIAGVLAMKPDCIVLDEPTAMLDPLGRKDVIETVMRLNREEGITIVLITHYMDEAVRADRVFVIDDGDVVMEGVPKEIFCQVDKLKGYGLDVPQVTEVSNMLSKKGIDIAKDVLNVDDMVSEICRIKGIEANLSEIKRDVPLDTDALKKEAEERFDGSENFDGIQIKNLTHIYNPGTTFEKKALDDVNISIKRGEFIGIIGHTGSGKSTLIQHLNAIMTPTNGGIFLDGTDIFADKTKLKSVRQRVGLVFQYPEHQLFEMTIYKDVAFGPTNMKLPEDEIKRRVKSALETVGLSEKYYEKSPFELSGGQKRRVAIAGVLAMEPEVLVLDEPTAGLDPKGRDEILDAVKKMQEKLGITVILVSHSMEDVAKLVSRIVVMHRGRCVMTGTPREVFARVDEIEKMGLAAPQISYVFEKLNNIGISVPKDVYTTDEAADVLYKLLSEKGGEN